MSARPDLAAIIAKNEAYWSTFKPEPAFKPAHILEAIKHRAFEEINAATMRHFDDREADQKKWFEGETPAVCDWNPETPLIEGDSRTLADHLRLARARVSDMQIDADATADLEAAAQEEAYHETRRIEAELERLQHQRESTYTRHCRNRTGETRTDEQHAKKTEEQSQLIEDSLEIALRLTAADRPALGTGPQTYIVTMLTEVAKPCINVRKRAIIPCVAAEKRAPLSRAAEFLLRTPSHKWDQFCTFTHGKRVQIDPVSAGWELRQAFVELHRKLSRLNSQPFMKLYGAEMLLRASEIGGLKDDKGELKRDEQGRVTAHPHAHCLIHFARFLSRDDMADWTRCVWAFWDAHWSIDGALEKIREAIKYCIKPADQKALSNAELAALDIALFKLHRVQAMGELKEHIRIRRETCLTVRKEWRAGKADRELLPVVLPDWNARKRDRKETLDQKRKKKLRAHLQKVRKNSRRLSLQELNRERREEWLKANAKHIEKHAQGDLFGPPMPPPPPEPVELKELPLGPAKAIRPPAVFRNRIVARLAPSFYDGPVSQPALLVWSDRPPSREDIRGMLSQSFVRPAIEAVRKQFDEAVASRVARPPEVRVHTSPVTVRPEKPRPAFLPALLRPSTWEKSAAPAAN